MNRTIIACLLCACAFASAQTVSDAELEKERADQIACARAIEERLGKATSVELISLDGADYPSKAEREQDTRVKLEK